MDALDGIDHVALRVRDIPRSVAWYQKVLGLERRFEEVWGDVPTILGQGTTAIALFPVRGDDPEPVPASDVVTMDHLAFRASRRVFEQAQHHLMELDIPFEFQDHTVAYSIYFNDPDGNQLEITTYEIEPGT